MVPLVQKPAFQFFNNFTVLPFERSYFFTTFFHCVAKMSDSPAAVTAWER